MPFTAIECHLRGMNGWYLSEHKGLTICSMNFIHVTSVIEIGERQDLLIQMVSYFPLITFLNSEVPICKTIHVGLVSVLEMKQREKDSAWRVGSSCLRNVHPFPSNFLDTPQSHYVLAQAAVTK